MRKLILFTFVALSCLPSFGQSGVQEARHAIAIEWLRDLCAIPRTDVATIDVHDTVIAFDRWIAEASNLNCSLTTEQDSDDNKKIHRSMNTTDQTKALSPLMPNIGERLLRMTEFQAEFQQTPDYVFGVLQSAPPGTVSSFLPNPDHKLTSYGGPAHLDELFIPSDVRVALCDAIGPKDEKQTEADAQSKQYLTATQQKNKCDKVEYLSAGRTIDRIARISSAVTLNFKISRMPRFQSGVVITDGPTAARERWSPTITGSFDSSKLYRSIAETKSLSAYVSAHPNLMDETAKGFSTKYLCGEHFNLDDPKEVKRCLTIYAVGARPQRSLLWLMPTITVKVTTPFDLAKYGNTFEAPPNHLGRSLYDASLTWNLHHVIPSATDRISAFTSLDAMNNQKAPPEPKGTLKTEGVSANMEWKRQIKVLYIELMLTPQVAADDQWWSQFRSLILYRAATPPKELIDVTQKTVHLGDS